MPREKNAKPVQHAPKSNALRNILDSAQALAKGRKRTVVTTEELFLATARNRKHSQNFPDDIVEKVAMVVAQHGRHEIPLDQSAGRLISAIEQLERVPGKQVDLLVKWIKNSALKHSETLVIDRFRAEEISGVKQLSPQGRILRQLHSIEMALHAVVKGQGEAIDRVLKQLAGWMLTPERDKRMPLKLAFCGPASCGKRLLAQAIAKAMKLENGNTMPFLEIDLKGYCSHQNWESLLGHSSSYKMERRGC